MSEPIISLAKKFISITSTHEHSKATARILELALSNLKEYTIERFERNGVRSALIYHAKTRPKKFKLLLNGHLDVIPGKASQYIPHIRGNRLYGAGAMDMKANVACLIHVFKEVGSMVSYPLGLQLVTDEESGGFDGTKYQIENGVRAEFVLAGESTNFNIVHKAKGILQVKISIHGKTGHGAYPWRGENAILKMNAFLTALQKKFPVPDHEQWVTTVNVSRIETSNATLNKIPDNCVLWLDVRFVPKDSVMIKKRIQRLLPSDGVCDIVAHEPALSTDEHHPSIKLLKKIASEKGGKTVQFRGAHGSSDARHFAKVHCPGIEFGPIGGGIGSDHEWVDIPSLETYTSILKHFLLGADS